MCGVHELTYPIGLSVFMIRHVVLRLWVLSTRQTSQSECIRYVGPHPGPTPPETVEVVELVEVICVWL